MILAGYFTPLYLLAGITLLIAGSNGIMESWIAKIIFVLAWIYILPPLLCRATLKTRGLPIPLRTNHTSRDYGTWWLLTQYQMLFNRFAFLEELLRLIPGCYALWLNAWGSQVSPYAYWSPGAYVTDRYILHIGHGCVIGTRSILSGHFIVQNTQGYELTVAPITLEPQSFCGFNTIIGPGCRVSQGETLPAEKILPPFSTWQNGKRQAGAKPPESTQAQEPECP